MHILLILALTLHPAAAKPVPSNRVVYSCPAGEELYIRVRGGADWLAEDGLTNEASGGIVIDGRDAYYIVQKPQEVAQADDRHYCIAK